MRKSTGLWVAAVIMAAAFSAGVTAQIVRPGQFSQPRILSGNDIGFRVDGQRVEPRRDPQTGRTAPTTLLTGQLMVKVDGQWVEADISAVKARPATN